MVFDERLAGLRDVLARLYRREPDIVRLLEDPEVGMDAASVEFHDRPVSTWHGILRQAVNQDKLRQIIALARKANPGEPALAESPPNVDSLDSVVNRTYRRWSQLLHRQRTLRRCCRRRQGASGYLRDAVWRRHRAWWARRVRPCCQRRRR